MKRIALVLLLVVFAATITSAANLNGQVLAGRNQAVSGASVVVTVWDQDRVAYRFRTVTNDRGLFTFDLGRYEGLAVVQASHPRVGFAVTRVQMTQRSDSNIQLLLEERPNRRRVPVREH